MNANALLTMPRQESRRIHLTRGVLSRGPVWCLGAAILLAWSPWAAGSDLTVHGFGTVGIAHVDKPADWAFARTFNQRVDHDAFRADLDTVVGVQLNYQASHGVELVGQAAAAVLDRDARFEDFVELAFLAWRPDPDWALRLGRVNLDAFLISDHRDVGYTYQFIRPPVEFYARMPASLDGGDVTHFWNAGTAQWQAKFFAGHTTGGLGDKSLHLSPVLGLMVARESDGLLLRISAVRSHVTNNIEALEPLIGGLQQARMLGNPQVATEAADMQRLLTTRDSTTLYIAAAAAYDRHDWLFSAEAHRSRVSNNPAVSSTSGYLSAGRRFGAFSVSLTQSATARDRPAYIAPDWATALADMGPELAQQFQAIADGAALAVNNGAGKQSTTSLGLRWDVGARLALKAQVDRTRTPRSGSALWLDSDPRRATSHVFAVAVDFVF